jgi:RNA polymerase sigma factor (sigma-70 family)
VPDELFSKHAFEAERKHLRGVAYRILGTASDADDAVQEAWLRLSNATTQGIGNPRAWLTTVIGRICFDMLRARRSRREDPLDESEAESWPNDGEAGAEDEAMLADSVGLALLITLERLEPYERLAFVLHDVFAVPFDAIAPILERSPAAARQIASRARRKVRGEGGIDSSSLDRRRKVIDAFLAASRKGDFAALVALLDPHVELQIDPRLLRPGMPALLRGADAVAKQALLGKGRHAQLALISGDVGIVVAAGTRLDLALTFALRRDRILNIDLIADPARLRILAIAVLDPVVAISEQPDDPPGWGGK